MFNIIIHHPLWNVTFFGNSIFDYAIAIITFVMALGFLRIVQTYAEKKRDQPREETSLILAKSFHLPYIAFLSAYIASRTLLLHSAVEKILSATLILWTVYTVILAVEGVINRKISKQKKEEVEETDLAATHLVNIGIKTVLWAIGLLMALTTIGVNVTSLAAGLGIGGIAVALAAQNILGDLFSSLSIYLDKPFIVGDTITVGSVAGINNTGVVEKIGLKTTRLRGLFGELIIISNRELTSARVQNFKKNEERNIIFIIKVSPETSAETLREIPKWIEEIIGKQSPAKFDRANFKNFGDTSFEFEIAYKIPPIDYRQSLEIQEKIDIGIAEKFEKEKIYGLSGKALPKT